ncbi:MAG TPA: hypothetical protein VLE19_17860 [Pyrinomonadaceae bacterium]|nr:hypothetical protein [Pyrinomonadaceae bacterium]
MKSRNGVNSVAVGDRPIIVGENSTKEDLRVPHLFAIELRALYQRKRNSRAATISFSVETHLRHIFRRCGE